MPHADISRECDVRAGCRCNRAHSVAISAEFRAGRWMRRSGGFGEAPGATSDPPENSEFPCPSM